MPNRLLTSWARFWMHFSGRGPGGRLATHLASWFAPPFYARLYLSESAARGYVAPGAIIHHSGLDISPRVHIDDEVLIFEDRNGGPVILGKNVHLWRGTIIQTGEGGWVKIGEDTHIQPHCQLSAYKGSLQIGRGVEIAPYCSFYTYDHGMARDQPVNRQPLESKGPIVVEDEVWLGVHVTILAGVRIGQGAVIGAGSVVTRNIPAAAVAVGIPARVVKMRGENSTYVRK